MGEEELYVLLSCPERRYQFPMRLQAASELNGALEKASHDYRVAAWPEHTRLNQWMLERLPAKQQQLHDAGEPAEQALTNAREILLAQGSQTLGIYPLSQRLMLCVGIETGPDSYFLDVEKIPLPFEPLDNEAVLSLWRRMQELKLTFEGIQIQR